MVDTNQKRVLHRCVLPVTFSANQKATSMCHGCDERTKRLVTAVLTAQHCANAEYAIAVCLSVCPSVHPFSDRHTMVFCKNGDAHSGLETVGFWCQRSWWNCNGVTPVEAPNTHRVGKICSIWQI